MCHGDQQGFVWQVACASVRLETAFVKQQQPAEDAKSKAVCRSSAAGEVPHLAAPSYGPE
jgi:hypothetical protein